MAGWFPPSPPEQGILPSRQYNVLAMSKDSGARLPRFKSWHHLLLNLSIRVYYSALSSVNGSNINSTNLVRVFYDDEMSRQGQVLRRAPGTVQAQLE